MNRVKNNIKLATQELKAGKMIILIDHPDRENEGDLVFPAETITPEVVNFMIRQGSGIVCLSLLESQVKKLGLDLMVAPHKNTSASSALFTTSIEARRGITTGVSAYDRAQTILAAVQEHATAQDIVTPGHVFPIQANEKGVLGRAGHTEGSMDIVKIAGFQPAAVICELMNQDGTMMKGEKLLDFAKEKQLFILSIEDIIHYRRLQF